MPDTDTVRMPETPTSEKRVLARLILRGKREQGAGHLSVEDFTTTNRKKLFEAYNEVSRRLPDFDAGNILNEAKLLLKGNELDQMSLENSLEDVFKGGGAPDLDEEIVHLKNYTKKRKLIEFASEAIAASKESAPDVTKLVDKLANLQAGGVKIKSFDVVMDDVLKQLRARWKNGNNLTGLTTTMPQIDHATGGIMGGEIAIIAGRPSSGKTSYVIQQVGENLKKGLKIAYFSLEMQEIEVMEKLISWHLDIDSRRISDPHDPETKIKVEEAIKFVKNWPLKLFDNVFSINDIVNTCWFLKETQGLDAVYIDYLQLVDANKKTFQSDNSSVAYVSRTLKILASQLNIPIVVGCQLNRRADMRDDQYPRLSDMRDSGAIEQDASIVLAMHFHEYTDEVTKKGIKGEYTVDKPNGKWATDGIVVLKNRRGKANFEAKLQFFPETSHFVETGVLFG